MMDYHGRTIRLAELEAYEWNEHVKVGQFVIVKMKGGALVKSRVMSAAQVGPLALRAAIMVLGIGWVAINRIKRKGQP